MNILQPRQQSRNTPTDLYKKNFKVLGKVLALYTALKIAGYVFRPKN